MGFSSEGPMAIPMWVNGHAFLTVGNAFFDVINPATGEVIRRVPLCGASEAAEAVLAARGAQPAWADMGLPARRVCLNNLADALESYASHFAKLLLAETGCNETQAAAEVAAAVEALRGGGVGDTGVVGLVLDASRPLAALAEVMVPALMAGAAMIVKPSPRAPSVAFALCELTARVEWPAGVLNLLQGDTAAIDGLCAAGVDRLVYSGNAALGVDVGHIAEAAETPYVMLAC